MEPQEDIKKTRHFGLALSFMLLLLGYFVIDESLLKLLVFSLALSALLLSVFVTQAIGPIHFLFKKITVPISWFNTCLLLTLCFYIVLLPTGLLMKLATNRRIDNKLSKDKRDSYWINKKRPIATPESLKRQF